MSQVGRAEAGLQEIPTTGSQHGRAALGPGPQVLMRMGGSVEAEEASAWKATLESGVPAHSQMTRVDLRSSGTTGTSKTPTLPSVKPVIQDLEEPCLDAQHRDSGLHEKVESGKRPPDSGPGELLQDCDAHALLQHRHSPAFLADSSASQISLCGSQSMSSGDMSAVHVSGDVMFSGWAPQQSSWGLNGSWRPAEQDKSQSKMFVPAGEEKACRRSNQGEHGRELAEPRASQDNGMLKNKDKETVESVRSKSCQLGLKEEQAPPESHFTKERQHFLQGIFSSKVPQQKGRPPSATAQSQGQHNSRSVPDSRAAGAQGIATAMGQIPEERITLQHGRPPSELNWHKGQFQAPAGENGATDFLYHKLLSCEEQGRVTREEACSLQATLKGHSSPGRSRQTRDKDGNRAFPPRELGCPARPSQQGPRVAGASACTHHCPRLCVIQNYVSPVQLVQDSLVFPGRTTFLQEKTHRLQKNFFLTSAHLLVADEFFLPQLPSFPKIHVFLMRGGGFCLCPAVGGEGVRVRSSHVPTMAS
ncbi:spermatogenesis-associated protein 31E1-like [Manis javanica]|uniref:spermatogenesis-associated protein 31E1-like n=1 Tax=Manis javanica TaxID=9974 RepID=UPI003C6D45BD